MDAEKSTKKETVYRHFIKSGFGKGDIKRYILDRGPHFVLGKNGKPVSNESSLLLASPKYIGLLQEHQVIAKSSPLQARDDVPKEGQSPTDHRTSQETSGSNVMNTVAQAAQPVKKRVAFPPAYDKNGNIIKTTRLSLAPQSRNAIQRSADKYSAWADAVTNHRLFKMLDAFGELPNRLKYEVLRNVLKGKMALIGKLTRDMYSILSRASESDSKAVYAYLTDRNGTTDTIVNPEMKAAAERTKRIIIKIGNALVAHGLITPDALKEHEGQYLPRLYLKHILGLGEQDFSSSGGTGKKAELNHLKQRADLSPEMRALLGKIKDPAYLSSRAISVPLRDISLMDFFRGIAANEEWVLPKQFSDWSCSHHQIRNQTCDRGNYSATTNGTQPAKAPLG